ncbi:RtcB family protein [Candidatus Pacearchaeota archaeon]|nr:RtcB family protein [Candidatus Pacearchaeota archaeon]
MEKEIYNHAIDLDEETKRQFEECYNEDFVTAAALMPDAHSGYVAPIGSVLLTKEYIVPAWVGFDIGCGLIAVKVKGKDNLVELVKKNQDEIYSRVLKEVPLGLGETNKQEKITEKTKIEFNKLIEKFKEGPHNKDILNFLKNAAMKHLGSLGAGNHFIELCFYKKELWIVIHSGSRGIGHKIAQKYMIKAAKSEKGYEKTFPLDINSELGKEYLNILDFGLSFALLNRLEMSYKITAVLEKVLKKKLKMQLWVNKNHNHAILERNVYIHRKGATPAKKGERGIIPANMRDGNFLVKGLGNPKFLLSSSHGAGRAMSRTKAKVEISMQEFEKSMEGIKGTINKGTLDEAPRAYKDISKVMEAQRESVKIIKHIKPLINWKG